MREAWKATPFDVAQTGQSLGPVEFQDHSGAWHVFHIVAVHGRLLFGGACNVGFIESGFIRREEGEDIDDTVQELISDLETYYNDGPEYVARIVCNDRM